MRWRAGSGDGAERFVRSQNGAGGGTVVDPGRPDSDVPGPRRNVFSPGCPAATVLLIAVKVHVSHSNASSQPDLSKRVACVIVPRTRFSRARGAAMSVALYPPVIDTRPGQSASSHHARRPSCGLRPVPAARPSESRPRRREAGERRAKQRKRLARWPSGGWPRPGGGPRCVAAERRARGVVAARVAARCRRLASAASTRPGASLSSAPASTWASAAARWASGPASGRRR